jgi:hypothetical protein
MAISQSKDGADFAMRRSPHDRLDNTDRNALMFARTGCTHGHARRESAMATTERKRLTLEDLKRMSQADIIAFWRQRQIEDRAAGRDHYTTLIDVHRDGTETVIADIDPVR